MDNGNDGILNHTDEHIVSTEAIRNESTSDSQKAKNRRSFIEQARKDRKLNELSAVRKTRIVIAIIRLLGLLSILIGIAAMAPMIYFVLAVMGLYGLIGSGLMLLFIVPAFFIGIILLLFGYRVFTLRASPNSIVFFLIIAPIFMISSGLAMLALMLLSDVSGLLSLLVYPLFIYAGFYYRRWFNYEID